MPSLSRYFWPCLAAICESINNKKKMTYGELAVRLKLKSAQQEWNTVLDLVAGKTKREVGHDLTWNVVYATGPARGPMATPRPALNCWTRKISNWLQSTSANSSKFITTLMNCGM